MDRFSSSDRRFNHDQRRRVFGVAIAQRLDSLNFPLGGYATDALYEFASRVTKSPAAFMASTCWCAFSSKTLTS
jgi:hypothetical protein